MLEVHIVQYFLRNINRNKNSINTWLNTYEQVKDTADLTKFVRENLNLLIKDKTYRDYIQARWVAKDMKVSGADYTHRHRIAFMQTATMLNAHNPKYAYHDVDKYLLYLYFTWLTKDEIQEIHRNLNKHHATSNKDDIDFVEAVIDWECARITKPDKPLNAYDTMLKFYPQYQAQVLPVLVQLGLYPQGG